MRLAIIADLWPGSTTLERAEILESLGIETVRFNQAPYHIPLTWWEQSLQSRINLGRGISAMNHALRKFARREKFDAVWVTKGNWIYPETISELKHASAAKLAIHHTNDALIYNSYASRHFFKSIPQYDIFVTTKPWEKEMYRSAGARDVLVVLHAHGRQFHPRNAHEIDPNLRSDICFVGHVEDHYITQLKSLSRLNGLLRDGIKVWGPGWPSIAKNRNWARSIIQGDGLWGSSYPDALAASRIALGLLNKKMPETSTSRTFEIPAMGVFMLAERTDELLSLYNEGVEAEFFGSSDELCDKARFYLENDAVRNRIAIAGYERTLKGGYSAEAQMRRVIGYISHNYSLSLDK
jgi:spore maturation protein CgeB